MGIATSFVPSRSGRLLFAAGRAPRERTARVGPPSPGHSRSGRPAQRRNPNSDGNNDRAGQTHTARAKRPCADERAEPLPLGEHGGERGSAEDTGRHSGGDGRQTAGKRMEMSGKMQVRSASGGTETDKERRQEKTKTDGATGGTEKNGEMQAGQQESEGKEPPVEWKRRVQTATRLVRLCGGMNKWQNSVWGRAAPGRAAAGAQNGPRRFRGPLGFRGSFRALGIGVRVFVYVGVLTGACGGRRSQ